MFASLLKKSHFRTYLTIVLFINTGKCQVQCLEEGCRRWPQRRRRAKEIYRVCRGAQGEVWYPVINDPLERDGSVNEVELYFLSQKEKEYQFKDDDVMQTISTLILRNLIPRISITSISFRD